MFSFNNSGYHSHYHHLQILTAPPSAPCPPSSPPAAVLSLPLPYTAMPKTNFWELTPYPVLPLELVYAILVEATFPPAASSSSAAR